MEIAVIKPCCKVYAIAITIYFVILLITIITHPVIHIASIPTRHWHTEWIIICKRA